MTAISTPNGHHTVTPYLMVSGTEKAIDFLKEVFEGEEAVRTLRSDGKVAHAEVRISGSVYVYVLDTDRTHHRAVRAGSVSFMAPTDLPGGDRMAAVQDPFGNVWWIVTPSQAPTAFRQSLDPTTKGGTRMDSSHIVLSGNKERDMHAVARWIAAHIEANWQPVFDENRDKLRDAYHKAGDVAYGSYLTYLFQPVHARLREVGLRPVPPLPGDFDSSREWGVAARNDEQRWMWSTITAASGEPLGTIVTVIFHDHTQFHVPRQPQIIALTETGKEAVVEALSRRSADFARAREASIEIAEFLESPEGLEYLRGQQDGE